ncbi:MAG: hypothetical protein CL569_16070 [Alphaproteobacteria bacterium]|nr:hypothetical protein [Alphaproteobacteria bacterium]
MAPNSDQSQSATTPKEAANQSAAIVESTDVIDVRYLLRTLLRWSWVIALVAGVAAARGAWNMHNFSPQFTAKMTVKPLENGGPGIASLKAGGASQLLGSLGGFQLNVSRSAGQFDRLVHRVSSLALARVLDEKFNMMEVVFGPAVNQATNEDEVQLGWRQRVRLFLKYSPPTKPTLEDLARYFGGNFKVKDDDKSPFKIITFSHKVPDKALWYLKTVFDEAVTYLREEIRAEQGERRDFLESRLAETEIVEMRRDLMGLITAEIRKEMLSHGDLPVGAQVVDEPFVSKYRTEPNALQFIGVPTVIAIAVTAGLILLIALYRAE